MKLELKLDLLPLEDGRSPRVKWAVYLKVKEADDTWVVSDLPVCGVPVGNPGILLFPSSGDVISLFPDSGDVIGEVDMPEIKNTENRLQTKIEKYYA